MRSFGRHFARIVGLVVLLSVVGLAILTFVDVIRLPFGLVDAEIRQTVELDGNLTVRGSTNLPDGALVTCEVWHESEDAGLGSGAFDVLRTIAVASGRFDCSTSVAGWPPGTIRVGVRFEPYLADQPADIREAYGSRGQRLGGTQVRHDSDGWILETVTDVQH